jgi:hypothetical protein
VALDHLPLPYLGRQARFLLDRVVASGDRGVDRRDAAEWALSRLIELHYVEESPLDTVAFVCTAAGLRRWRIEVVADERRESEQLRRQLIRQRLDTRFSSSGVGTSTALAVVHAPAAPRYHGGLPAVVDRGRQSRTRSGWAPAMAALFATATAASVIILSSAEPSDVRDWLFPPTARANVPAPPQPRAAALIDRPKGDAELASAEAAVTAPIDTHDETVAAPVDARAAGIEPEIADVAALPPQTASVSANAPMETEEASAQPADAVAPSPPPEDIAVAVAPSGPVVAETDASVADPTDAGEPPGGQVPAAAVAEQVMPAKQVPDESPAPALIAQAVATPRLIEREQPATPLLIIARGPEAVPVAAVQARPDKRVVEKTSPVDPQSAIVERLNGLSLAAARRGEEWRPSGALGNKKL